MRIAKPRKAYTENYEKLSITKIWKAKFNFFINLSSTSETQKNLDISSLPYNTTSNSLYKACEPSINVNVGALFNELNFYYWPYLTLTKSRKFINHLLKFIKSQFFSFVVIV